MTINIKQTLRQQMKERRAQIPEFRRKAAVHALLDAFKSSKGLILSFASVYTEIDTQSLNLYLAESSQLVLPRVQNGRLILHRVSALSHLALSNWNILEPIPQLCPEISVEKLALVLVPGLAFDAYGHRLGYGKGFYDKLLSSIPKHTQTMGISFLEQRHSQPLPLEMHDTPVHQVLYF